MFRSRIINLSIHRNISSINGSIISTNPRSASNLKQLNLNSVLSNDICNKNCQIITNEITETIFPIPINNSLLNPNNINNINDNNESRVRNFPIKRNGPYFSSPVNKNFTNNKIFLNTSTFLSPNQSSVKKMCIERIGARQFSSETNQRAPAIELTGFWKDMSESTPVAFIQENLIAFQSTTHLPWWATVILTTFIVRGTMTLPLSLYQHYIFAKIQNLQIEMNDIVKRLKIEANVAVSHYKWDENYARKVYDRSLKKQWDQLIQRENCHPAKGFIVLWTQIPLWIAISAALRNLCYMLPPGNSNAERIYLELTTGGFGWVTNLIDVDHYWILPVSIGIFNLTNIEIMSLMKIKEDTRLQKYLLYFFRFISIAMVPIATYVPSCICLYWASSSAFGLLQNLVLLSPKVRRFGGVPLTKTERQNPYRDLVAKFRAKKYLNFNRKSQSLE